VLCIVSVPAPAPTLPPCSGPRCLQLRQPDSIFVCAGLSCLDLAACGKRKYLDFKGEVLVKAVKSLFSGGVLDLLS